MPIQSRWIALFLPVVFASLHAGAQSTCLGLSPGPSIVSVNGRQLLVQKRNPDKTLMPAAAYSIKGVCWSPASKTTNTSAGASNNAQVRRNEFLPWYKRDIPLLKKMNVNTVRTYMDFGSGDSTKAILDEFYCNDIMVIMTVDDAINDIDRVRNVVTAFKDHPAILMWMIGNEWNIFHYYLYDSITTLQAAERTEAAASLIKSIDPNHPVSTCYGDIDINTPGKFLDDTRFYVNNICTSVDVWGLNIYRGGSFGTLFSQWKSISNKPMFISEFGTDAFKSDSILHPPTGHVDEVMQAGWNLALWKEIFRHLSAYNPLHETLGGTVFEFNDEWWKTGQYNQQETHGHTLNPHPDDFSNEEYYGMTDIDRKKRAVYDTLRAAFHPAYNVPGGNLSFKAESAGYNVPGTSNGFVKFYKNNYLLYNGSGSVDGQANRGFNICAIDTATGDLLVPRRNFDTWITSATGTEMRKMISFLDSLPNGTLIMIAIRDEAGLNDLSVSPCTPLPRSWVDSCFMALEALGSNSIRNYCFRNSWAMIAIKGQGVALSEELKSAMVAAAQASILVKPTLYPASLCPAPIFVSPGCDSLILSDNTILRWTPSEGAALYHLQVSDDSMFVHLLLEDIIADTARLVTSLENKKRYYSRVRSMNAAGAGRWSCVNTFTARMQPYVEVISAPVISGADTFKVKYQFSNALIPGNNFILQLTDASGNQSTYSVLATFNDTARTGILAAVPGVQLACGTNYRVRVISTNPVDTSNNSNTFAIRNAPPARIQPPVSDSACTGQQIELQADAVAGGTYQWLRNDTVIAGETGQTYRARSTAAYKVRVSKDGCDSLSQALHLRFKPLPPARIQPPVSDSACAGQEIELQADAVAGGTYQWLRNDTVIVGETGQTYTARSTAAYKVRVTVNGCDSASLPVILTFNKLPPKPVITRSNDTLRSSSPDGNQWFKDGVAIFGATGQFHKASPIGIYTVQVTLKGCTSEMSNPIGGTDQILVYPNPTSHNHVYIINYDSTKSLILEMYDMMGRLLKVQRLQWGNNLLYIGYLPKGHYVLSMKDEVSGKRTSKIIIKR